MKNYKEHFNKYYNNKDNNQNCKLISQINKNYQFINNKLYIKTNAKIVNFMNKKHYNQKQF